MENSENLEKKKKMQKEAMKEFYKNHPDSYTCEICYGKYKYFNKYHHNKTKRHLQFVELNKQKNNN